MDSAVRVSLSSHLIGDYFLLMGEIILLLYIHRKRNFTGISLKTQILLAIVFSIRYMDLTISYLKAYGYSSHPSVTPIIVYNAMKVVHVFVIYWTILIVYLYFNGHDDRKFDTFRNEILIVTCAIITILFNYDLDLTKIMRTFSYCLEAVATLPQTYLISKARNLDSVIIYYIGFLSLYKLSHIISWVYSIMFLITRFESIALFAGILQVIIYLKFFISNVLLCSYKLSSTKINSLHDDRANKVKIAETRNQLNQYKINASNV